MPVIIVSLAKSGWFSEQRDGKNAILVPRTEPPTQGRFRHDPDVERRVLPTKTTAQVGGRNGSAERRPGLRAARAAVVKIAFSLGFALPRLSFRATRKRLKKSLFEMMTRNTNARIDIRGRRPNSSTARPCTLLAL
jgi:hypothetical protein